MKKKYTNLLPVPRVRHLNGPEDFSNPQGYSRSRKYFSLEEYMRAGFTMETTPTFGTPHRLYKDYLHGIVPRGKDIAGEYLEFEYESRKVRHLNVYKPANSAFSLVAALDLISNYAGLGESILFVIDSEIMGPWRSLMNFPHHVIRGHWVPGLLTNYNISHPVWSADRTGSYQLFPSLVVLLSKEQSKKDIPAREAKSMGIPVVGVTDLYGHIKYLDYPIVCSHSQVRVRKRLLSLVVKAVLRGAYLRRLWMCG